MSEIKDTLFNVIAERAPTFSDVVTLVRTGQTFNAEIQPIADIESNMLLGRDARESVLFHVLDRDMAAAINEQDELTALGNTFVVLRRTDNPVSNQVEFGTMKLTPYDN